MSKVNEISDGKGNTIKILGIVGLSFSNNIENYFIDSELLDGKEYDIAIFRDKIRYFEKENKTEVNSKKKEEILTMVLKLFSLNGVRVLVLK